MTRVDHPPTPKAPLGSHTFISPTAEEIAEQNKLRAELGLSEIKLYEGTHELTWTRPEEREPKVIVLSGKTFEAYLGYQEAKASEELNLTLLAETPLAESPTLETAFVRMRALTKKFIRSLAQGKPTGFQNLIEETCRSFLRRRF